MTPRSPEGGTPDACQSSTVGDGTSVSCSPTPDRVGHKSEHSQLPSGRYEDLPGPVVRFRGCRRFDAGYYGWSNTHSTLCEFLNDRYGPWLLRWLDPAHRCPCWRECARPCEHHAAGR